MKGMLKSMVPADAVRAAADLCPYTWMLPPFGKSQTLLLLVHWKIHSLGSSTCAKTQPPPLVCSRTCSAPPREGNPLALRSLRLPGPCFMHLNLLHLGARNQHPPLYSFLALEPTRYSCSHTGTGAPSCAAMPVPAAALPYVLPTTPAV